MVSPDSASQGRPITILALLQGEKPVIFPTWKAVGRSVPVLCSSMLTLKGQLLHLIEELNFAILSTAKSVASHCSHGSNMMGKMCVWWKIGLWLQQEMFCNVCGSCSGNVQHTFRVCTMGLCPLFSPPSTPSLPPPSSPTAARDAHCCLTGAPRALQPATWCNWPTRMPTGKPAVPLEVPGASSLTLAHRGACYILNLDCGSLGIWPEHHGCAQRSSHLKNMSGSVWQITHWKLEGNSVL